MRPQVITLCPLAVELLTAADVEPVELQAPTDQAIRVAHQPVTERQRLRGARRRLGAQTIREGTTALAPAGISGTALEIVAELNVGEASEVGLKVRTGADEETVIGVDTRAGRLFVDRTRSGQVGPQPELTGRQTVPLSIDNGRVRLHIFVDWSSIEVLAGAGETVITDQIFASPHSKGVALYARGGAARLVSLDAWPLRSI
jgi:sucrose-6-phosphate hydrolase SacC (GH32 family)